MKIELPEYAHVVRSLGCGLHPYRKLLPRFEESPAARRLIGEISHIFLKSAFAISDNCILNEAAGAADAFACFQSPCGLDRALLQKGFCFIIRICEMPILNGSEL